MQRKQNVLIVDDKAVSRKFLKSLLESMGYDTVQAVDGVDALNKLHSEIDLVLMDAMMPVMDGFEATRRIRKNEETIDLPIIMVTALDSQSDRLKAIAVGVNHFITKPVDKTELKVRATSLLKMKMVQDAIKHHKTELEIKVAERTADLLKTLTQLRLAHSRTHKAYEETIKRLCVAAEYKDKDTGTHITRVCGYCELIAKQLKLPPDDVEKIKIAGAMHDIGKIGIPDHVLLKPGKLTPEEWKVMRQHSYIGALILKGSESELLQAGEIIAYSHHEKWDGSGYPRGLAAENIPLYGRICALADVFDALTSKRPYKEAFSNEKGFEIMRAGRGRDFDPQLFDIFFDRKPDILAIQDCYREEPEEYEEPSLNCERNFLKTIIPLIRQQVAIGMD